jgi:hypothetical protein
MISLEFLVIEDLEVSITVDPEKFLCRPSTVARPE